jgi:GT2 family glycosyltransferase
MNGSASPPLVSVIVICHNDGRWLPKCLESIRAQTLFSRIELIVADNASSDGTDEQAMTLIAGWTNAKFYPTGGDNGFGVACNRASNLATGKYFYFLNPDLWLEPDCIERLYETAEREHAAAVGGTVLEYEDNTVQVMNCNGFDLFGNGMPVKDSPGQGPIFAIACFYFVRRESFRKVGMLDEKFFLYGEEMDLAWRLWIGGEKLMPAAGAKVHHRGAAGVNPAGGARAVENRTSIQKRFLANRNRLLGIAKNCQNLLLLMFIPCSLLVLFEGALTFAMTRNLKLAKETSFNAIYSCWELRQHIRLERSRIAGFRQHGDFWMMRFFRFGFGRWYEVRQILKGGFPRFN